MKRYIKLYLQFIKNCLIREAEFRTNFISHTVSALAQSLLAILGLNVLFGHIQSVAGWSYAEVLLLLGIGNILQGIFFGPLIQNMARLVSLVNEGALDFALLLPISSQFYVSTRRIRLFSFARLITGIVITLSALNQLGIAPNPTQIAIFAFLLLCSIVICYSLWFISITPVIWFSRLFGVHEIFLTLYQISQKPPEIFKGALRIFLTVGLPLLVPVIFPTKVLLGNISWAEILWAPVAAIGLLYISNRFWNFALKYYSGASA